MVCFRARTSTLIPYFTSLVSVVMLSCAHMDPVEEQTAAAGESAMAVGTDSAQENTGMVLDSTAPIQISERVYSLEDGSQALLFIPFTYHNRTGAIAYPARCGYEPPRYQLEKLVAEEWVLAYEQVCFAIHIPEPVVVGPGEVYMDTAAVVVAPNFRHAVFRIADIPGTYRLVLRIYKNREPNNRGGELLSKDDRLSNEFRITQ